MARNEIRKGFNGTLLRGTQSHEVLQNRLTEFAIFLEGWWRRRPHRRIENVRKLRIEKVMPLTRTRAAEEAAGTEDLA
jgi:hypothetical protein